MDFSLFFTIALVSSYAYVGGGIKYLDQIIDQHLRSEKHPWILWFLTLSLIVITTLIVFFDYFTAILAIALLLGLLVTRKVDNKFFAIIGITVLPIGIWVFCQLSLPFLLASLIPLLVSVIIDELLHGVAPRISSSTLRWVLTHRLVLKGTVIILPFFGLLTFVHTVAFWSFDTAYDVVAYSLRAPNTNTKSTTSV